MARSLVRGLRRALAWIITHALLAVVVVLALSFVEPARQESPHLAALHGAAVDGWALVAPGGRWHPTAFIEHKGHLVVEGFLLLVISYLLLQGTLVPGAQEETALTEKVRWGGPDAAALRHAASAWLCRAAAVSPLGAPPWQSPPCLLGKLPLRPPGALQPSTLHGARLPLPCPLAEKLFSRREQVAV